MFTNLLDCLSFFCSSNRLLFSHKFVLFYLVFFIKNCSRFLTHTTYFFQFLVFLSLCCSIFNDRFSLARVTSQRLFYNTLFRRVCQYFFENFLNFLFSTCSLVLPPSHSRAFIFYHHTYPFVKLFFTFSSSFFRFY